jgi:3-dehydroquinate synthase
MSHSQSPSSSEATELVRFSVPFEYPVHFTAGVFAPENTLLREVLTRLEPERRHRIHVVIDAGLAAARPTLSREVAEYFRVHQAALELVATPLLIPGGESAKNDPALIQSLLQAFADTRLDRHAFCLIVGGGAVLDAVGFAAATAHRGIRVVRVPTTVLGQNDAGIGVKNGVNAFGAKNFIGCFAPPFAVLNDHEWLQTLPRRDRIAGMAEAVKVALIRDRDFFEWLWANRAALAAFESEATRYMIRRAAALHLRQISSGGDPFESGSARPLDFGHWSAHKLERLTEHALRHGEAVAIGMALDTRYSFEQGLIGEADLERVTSLLTELGFELFHSVLGAQDAEGQLLLLRGLDEFREHLGGDLSIPLLDGIGRSVDVSEFSAATVERCISWLGSRYAESNSG